MTTLEAMAHPSQDLIIIARTPGRIITIDYYEARALVDQLLNLLAAHDKTNRIDTNEVDK